MARLVKPLAATQVQNAKPKESMYKLFDGGGLFLQVTPAGGKHWKLKYRRDDGKEGLLSFGAYPDVSLEQARKKRDEARAQRRALTLPKLNAEKSWNAPTEPKTPLKQSPWSGWRCIARRWRRSRCSAINTCWKNTPSRC